mmetsp:Transcript_45396/g.52217  ORF Transcript_45396/g.52217 Transcript_45396/m.52217 type:complete len:151 (-) Transcript_45396:1721-2173(-)
MADRCKICQEEPWKYKCVKCYIKYCSLDCYKVHQKEECKKIEVAKQVETVVERVPEEMELDLEDVIVKATDLEKLKHNSELTSYFTNQRFRTKIREIDGAEFREDVLDDAMQDPEFTAIMDKILDTIGYKDENNQFVYHNAYQPYKLPEM